MTKATTTALATTVRVLLTATLITTPTREYLLVERVQWMGLLMKRSGMARTTTAILMDQPTTTPARATPTTLPPTASSGTMARPLESLVKVKRERL